MREQLIELVYWVLLSSFELPMALTCLNFGGGDLSLFESIYKVLNQVKIPYI